MEIQLLLLHISLLMSSLWFLSCSSAILGVASSPSLAKPNCSSHCGGIEIPYPFGIGPDCYLYDIYSRGFQILCDNSTNNSKPLLNLTDSIRPEVLEISPAEMTVKIKNPITFSDCPNKPNHRQTPYLPNLMYTPFSLSMKNKFTSVSCGMIASLTIPDPTSPDPVTNPDPNRVTNPDPNRVTNPNPNPNRVTNPDPNRVTNPNPNPNPNRVTNPDPNRVTNPNPDPSRMTSPTSPVPLTSPDSVSSEQIMAVCLSICSNTNRSIIVNNSCGGINCCQTSLPFATVSVLNIGFEQFTVNGNGGTETERYCKYAFLVDQEWFTSSSTNTSLILEMDDVPIVLDWGIYPEMDNSTEDNVNRNCESPYGPCSCSKGYQGNPYIRGGCQDIDECEDPRCGSGSICINHDGGYECYAPQPRPIQPIKLGIIVPCSVFGLLFLIIGAWWLHKFIKKRSNIKRKQKFFRLNGGLLLEQQLSSGEVNVEKIKLFNEKELEKATDRFHVDRILGQGGQGTVYKGMLTDGRIVAVKKSKIIDGGEVRQFITEIVILSQINHRNVVKLLGCCLESEVPLLVYEFLPNGTLSQYIQSRDEDFPLTWEVRLRVGIEVAGAISYLHSSASNPIYHRDIKSSNILLDDKYRAKIADFGTSRSVAIDQTHLTMTHVNGTFGYLDPEYFQSSQFTDKSDVYSFGVVLAELLTGQKPVAMTRSHDGRQDGRSLATNFIVSMEEGRLFDILDAEVMKGGKKQDILAVANLAKRCLNMKGKKRPTMKEIAVELEGILMASRSSDVEQHIAGIECVQAEITEVWDVVSTSTGSHMDTSSSLDVQPLLSFKTI